MVKLMLGALLGAVVLAGCAGNNDVAPAGGAAASASPPAATRPAAAAAASADFSREVSRLVSEEDEVVAILENGMVVIARRVASPVVSIRGYVKAGGIHEGRWLGGGLSHLLEHLVAGGTNERRSEAANRDLLQRIGNVSNAYTYPDHTAYYVNTTAEHLEAGVDLITGWMLGAKITEAEYRREYEVVQRELEKGEGEPDRVFYKLIQRNRYQVSPARVPVIGYKEVIQGLTRDDVYAYYRLAYVPNNMVFAIAGDVDPERAVAAVRRYVRDAAPGRVFPHDVAEEPPVTAPRTLVGTFPKLGEARLDLAFPTVKLGHPDMYPLDLLATALGVGESSLLVEELRDRRGLVSSVTCYDYTPPYVDGSFTVSMELDAAKIPEATRAVLEILERVRAEGVSEERLQRARTQTRTQRAFSQQTSEAVANSMATGYLQMGDVHFDDRYVERMERVTAEQVKDAARRHLDPGKLLTTALLPEEAVGEGGIAGAEKLLRRATTTRPATRPAAGSAQVVRSELGDGTVLLVKRVDAAPVVSISLYADGGLTAEDAATNGLGNLAMQLAPRGTKTRTARQVAEFFDATGGQLNTACGNNTWSWTATCLKGDLAATLEVFADVVRNPVFPDAEVELARRRILAAIDAQDADWFAGAFRFFRAEYFGPEGSPYRFLSIGTRKNVEAFKAEQVRRWYAERILKAPRVLAIFGDVDVEQARKLAAAAFGPEGPRAGRAEGPRPRGAAGGAPSSDATGDATPSIRVRQVRVRKTANPQAGVIIGFDARPVVGEPTEYPLAVADTLATGYRYPTGYIFEILRGRGLVYDANAFVMPGRSSRTPGAFVAYAGCDPKDVNEVVDVILENVARLQGSEADMNPEWFARARQLIVISDALDNETAAEQAQTAALDELFGLGHRHHEAFAERVRAVTPADVRAAARALLRECVVTISTSEADAVQVKEGVRTYDAFAPVDLTPRGIGHDGR